MVSISDDYFFTIQGDTVSEKCAMAALNTLAGCRLRSLDYAVSPETSAKLQGVIHCLIFSEKCYIKMVFNLNCYILMKDGK
jgi:hypothetical protein